MFFCHGHRRPRSIITTIIVFITVVIIIVVIIKVGIITVGIITIKLFIIISSDATNVLPLQPPRPHDPSHTQSPSLVVASFNFFRWHSFVVVNQT